MYGSFDQSVVFDFGKTSYLVQRFNADVQSASLSEISIVSQPVIASAIWGERSIEVVRFGHTRGEALRAEHLSRRYSLPEQVKITADHLHQDNYKTVMHQLLFEEERFMKSEISRYVLCTKYFALLLRIDEGFPFSCVKVSFSVPVAFDCGTGMSCIEQRLTSLLLQH